LLKVRYLLQGSVRRDGRRVRIAAQLIDAAEDVHLWGDSFEGPPDDAFAIQQRLACLIAEALRLRLTPREAQQLGEQPITDVGAYECYLRARQESWRWHPDSLNRAVRLLQQALEIGGDNARVYAALGIAHLQYREAGVDLSERPLARAQRCARQVFALQPQAAVGAQLMGWIAYSRGAIQQAVRDLKVALAAEPHNPDTLLLLSNCYLISGKVPAARPLLERLASVDPLTPLSLCMPAFADILDGKPERAIKPYRAMLERDPANPVARLFLVWVLVLNDRMRQAATIVKTCPADAHDTLAAQLMRFLAAAPRSEPGALRAMLTPQVESAAAASDVFPRILAQGFALAGDRRAALRWLTIAVERGFINWPFLAHHDPCLRQLRRERGFRELLDRVRGRWRAFEV
jgi:tetratricopeptide (TPR) repeat protein